MYIDMYIYIYIYIHTTLTRPGSSGSQGMRSGPPASGRVWGLGFRLVLGESGLQYLFIYLFSIPNNNNNNDNIDNNRADGLGFRFRGGLVFKAHRICVSLNSRLESNKEEEETVWGEGVD